MQRLKAPERRTQLMKVASELFAARGFDATTTAAIAAAAGVSEPILYRHFRSKQEMFAAIVTEVSQTTQAAWNQQSAGAGDAAEQFRTLALEWPKHLAVCSAPYRVIHNAMISNRDPAVVATLRRHYDAMHAYFVELIQRGQVSGVFRKDLDVPATSWWLLERGIGYTLITLSMGPGAGADNAKSIDLILDAISA